MSNFLQCFIRLIKNYPRRWNLLPLGVFRKEETVHKSFCQYKFGATQFIFPNFLCLLNENDSFFNINHIVIKIVIWTIVGIFSSPKERQYTFTEEKYNSSSNEVLQQSAFNFSLLVGETLQWIWWQHTNKQAGGPKHRASFSSICLPDMLVIKYMFLLKDVQKGRVNTSLEHTLAQTHSVENSVLLWRGEKERVTGDWDGGREKQKESWKVVMRLSAARFSAVPPVEVITSRDVCQVNATPFFKSCLTNIWMPPPRGPMSCFYI